MKAEDQKIQVYRKTNGHLEYLAKDKTNWTRKESDAAVFATRDQARNVRGEVAGPPPARSFGTYPMITPTL